MHKVLRHIADEARALGLSTEEPVVVAASGGVDSTVLVHCLAESGFPVVAAYVHHGIRAEADDEAQFVTDLAASSGLLSEILRIELPRGGNVKASARDARYHALAGLAERVGVRAVAVGHTADDQAETVLMNLVRGAGLRGLAGMPPSRKISPESAVTLVRPMLGLTRAEVSDFARSRGWAWREDSSNASDRYLRNRIRQQVLPLLEAEGGPATTRRIALAADAARAALDEPPTVFVAISETLPDGGAIPLDALARLTSTVRHAVWLDALRAWAPNAPRRRSVLPDLDALLDAHPGRHVPLGGMDIWRDRDRIRIQPSDSDWSSATCSTGTCVATPWGTLTISDPRALSALDASSSTSQSIPPRDQIQGLTIRLSAAALDEPLTLRTWRSGERLLVRGRPDSVLVADLLTRSRVQPSARARQLVLASGDEPVWLVGHAIAATALPTPQSRSVIEVCWTPVAGLGVPR